ncbi:MAG: integrase core domain-containing protein [Bdellovibrionota bacterium]
MKRCNQGWGALRISQELLLLGIKVSKTTVATILKRNGFTPPKTRMTPSSWEAFFNHHKHIWAMDFHNVFDTKGNQLFILVLLNTFTRELVAINATLNPNKNWIIQQFCNASMSGYQLPTGLIADNDGIYGNWLDQALKGLFDIDVPRISIKEPWKNGRCERFHLTIKTEILNRIDITDFSQAQKLCLEYQSYYNASRPHQALDGQNPCDTNSKKCNSTSLYPNLSYKKTTRVGGLITEFSLAA